MTLTPFHSALYFNTLTNSLQETSPIEFARLWFCIIPLTFKSSRQIQSKLFMRFTVKLWMKSILWLWTFLWIFASLNLIFSPRFERWVLLFLQTSTCEESFLWTLVMFLCCDFLNFGLSITSPFDKTAKLLIPKSIPIVFQDPISLWFSEVWILNLFQQELTPNIHRNYPLKWSLTCEDNWHQKFCFWTTWHILY